MTTAEEVCQVTCLVERQVPNRRGQFCVGGDVKQSDPQCPREPLNGEAEKVLIHLLW